MTTLKRSFLIPVPLAFMLAGGAFTARTDGSSPEQAQGETSPAGPGARFPSLARSTDGRIAMVWTDRGADSVSQVRIAIRSSGGQWSSPATVVRDSTLFVNFADVPRVEWVAANDVAVSWLQKTGAGRYDYGVRVARSKDGGRTWVRSASPHDSTEAGEHGFVSLVPLPNARVAVTYLNGHAHGEGGTSGGTQVAISEYDAKGALAKLVTLDRRACDCCQTAAASTSKGMVVVYRDRSADEVRDIAVTRQVNGRWTEPAALSHDRWKINACPVNGPAIAASGQRVVVGWFSAARDTGKVQLTFSNDAGATFGAPIRIDGGTPVGHVDVLMNTDGSAIVSWLERGQGQQLSVRMRRVSPNRTMSTPITISEVQGIRPTGWPSIVENGDGVLVAWTVPGSPSRIQLQQIRRTALR
jgi:hypothetical protein